MQPDNNHQIFPIQHLQGLFLPPNNRLRIIFERLETIFKYGTMIRDQNGY